MGKVKLNRSTEDAVIDLQCLCGELEGIFEDREVQVDAVAALALHVRRTERDDDGTLRHTTEYSTGGSPVLLAGGLAKLFEDRPALHDRVEGILQWRRSQKGKEGRP